MNTSKTALNFDPNDPPVLTPVETIVSMFEHTDADGILCIPAWPYDDDAEQGMLYKCRMRWTEADRDAVLRLCESCYDTMKSIARQCGSVRDGVDAAALSEAQKPFWNTYLRDFGSEDNDAICAEAEARVGKSPAAYDVILRARRMCRLMTLEAPEIILRSEANLFAQALVIHGYCEELEIVEEVE